jgi:hypothetical protein
MKEQVGLLIEDVPAAVRDAVERDAQQRDMSRNDVVCEILSRQFRVRFTPTGYPYRDSEGATDWNIRVPVELREAIRRYAEGNSRPGRRLGLRGVTISTLELHYDLPVTSPRKRPSVPPLDPDIVREARARAEAGESVRSLSRRYGIPRASLAKAIKA